METMKHQDGFAPSAEDTAKINEFVTWLTDHGYQGIMLLHKGGIGVSWLHDDAGADSIRHTLICSLGHIAKESVEAARDLMNGMILAVEQIEMA